MNFKRLEAQIRKDEGFRSKPYLDTVGVATIGFGTTHILGEPVTLDTPEISYENARQLLRADLWGAVIDAVDLFDRFNEMNDVRQEVLVNMAYNLGLTGLANFKRLRSEAWLLRYENMAHEMQDSKWFRQVGRRAVRLVEEMRSGTKAV